MPVKKVGTKWAIGKGKAMYTTKAAAERAYEAYLARRYGSGKKKKGSADSKIRKKQQIKY